MILFSDFDHTFYFREKPEQTKQNILALRRWKMAGHQFVLATGRDYSSLKNTVGPAFMPACEYLILDGGSIVCDNQGKLIRTFAFSPEVIYSIEQAVSSDPNHPVIAYFSPNSMVFESTTRQVTKIRIWFENPDAMASLIDSLKTLPVLVFTDSDPLPSPHWQLEGKHSFIEVIPENSGKQKGVETIISMLNIPPEQVITVGDNYNDYHMIKDFNGFAVIGSALDADGADFKKVDSFADLISSLLNQN